MSAGAPVLASDLGAFRRVLDDGRLGVLFPVGDDRRARLLARRAAGRPPRAGEARAPRRPARCAATTGAGWATRCWRCTRPCASAPIGSARTSGPGGCSPAGAADVRHPHLDAHRARGAARPGLVPLLLRQPARPAAPPGGDAARRPRRAAGPARRGRGRGGVRCSIPRPGCSSRTPRPRRSPRGRPGRRRSGWTRAARPARWRRRSRTTSPAPCTWRSATPVRWRPCATPLRWPRSRWTCSPRRAHGCSSPGGSTTTPSPRRSSAAQAGGAVDPAARATRRCRRWSRYDDSVPPGLTV